MAFSKHEVCRFVPESKAGSPSLTQEIYLVVQYLQISARGKPHSVATKQ